MSKSAQDQGPVAKWVTFYLDRERYGVNVMQVQEVLRFTEITHVVTVIDTRQRFMLGPKAVDDATRIVIMEAEGQVIGILVDSVAEVVELRASEIESAPNVGNEESARFVLGVSSLEGELLILIDLDKLFTGAQKRELAAL